MLFCKFLIIFSHFLFISGESAFEQEPERRSRFGKQAKKLVLQDVRCARKSANDSENKKLAKDLIVSHPLYTKIPKYFQEWVCILPSKVQVEDVITAQRLIEDIASLQNIPLITKDINSVWEGIKQDIHRLSGCWSRPWNAKMHGLVVDASGSRGVRAIFDQIKRLSSRDALALLVKDQKDETPLLNWRYACAWGKDLVKTPLFVNIDGYVTAGAEDVFFSQKDDLLWARQKVQDCLADRKKQLGFYEISDDVELTLIKTHPLFSSLPERFAGLVLEMEGAAICLEDVVLAHMLMEEMNVVHNKCKGLTSTTPDVDLWRAIKEDMRPMCSAMVQQWGAANGSCLNAMLSGDMDAVEDAISALKKKFSGLKKYPHGGSPLLGWQMALAWKKGWIETPLLLKASMYVSKGKEGVFFEPSSRCDEVAQRIRQEVEKKQADMAFYLQMNDAGFPGFISHIGSLQEVSFVFEPFGLMHRKDEGKKQALPITTYIKAYIPAAYTFLVGALSENKISNLIAGFLTTIHKYRDSGFMHGGHVCRVSNPEESQASYSKKLLLSLAYLFENTLQVTFSRNPDFPPCSDGFLNVNASSYLCREIRVAKCDVRHVLICLRGLLTPWVRHKLEIFQQSQDVCRYILQSAGLDSESEIAILMLWGQTLEKRQNVPAGIIRRLVKRWADLLQTLVSPVCDMERVDEYAKSVKSLLAETCHAEQEFGYIEVLPTVYDRRVCGQFQNDKAHRYSFHENQELNFCMPSYKYKLPKAPAVLSQGSSLGLQTQGASKLGSQTQGTGKLGSQTQGAVTQDMKSDSALQVRLISPVTEGTLELKQRSLTLQKKPPVQENIYDSLSKKNDYGSQGVQEQAVFQSGESKPNTGHPKRWSQSRSSRETFSQHGTLSRNGEKGTSKRHKPILDGPSPTKSPHSQKLEFSYDQADVDTKEWEREAQKLQQQKNVLVQKILMASSSDVAQTLV